MKKIKIIACLSAFAMISGLGINYISAEESGDFIYGDLDGDGVEQMDDLIKMSQSLLRDIELNDNQKKAADVNADGIFDIADLPTMKQYLMHDDIELGKVRQSNDKEDNFDISRCKLISQKIGFTRDCELFGAVNKKQLLMVIDSEEKFTEFKDFGKKEYDIAIDNIESEYDLSADFFKENTLFIIARQEENGGVKAQISDINISEERGISFKIKSDYSNDDYSVGISTWLHSAAIPNKYLEGVDTSQTRINNTGAAAGYNYLDISACDTFNCKTSDYFDFMPVNDNDFKMSAVIRSQESFDNYNKKFNNAADKLYSYFGISEEFFKNNTLFIIPVTEGSGSIKNEITNIGINSDNKVSIEYTSYVPVICQDDVVTWNMAVAVPNNLICSIDTTDFEVDHVIKREKDLTDDNVLDLSDCEKIDCPAPFYYDSDYRYDAYINPSLVTSKEELYQYNRWLKFMTDIVRPYRDNWEGMLSDNVMVSVDCIGHSGMVDHFITGISVDENNKITVDLTIATPAGPLTCDYGMTHLCLLVPRKYLNQSSAQPTLEVIRHDVERSIY